jgi:hypothetical protein
VKIQKNFFTNKKLFPKIIFGAHRSEVTLFWGRFGCINKKLSVRTILEG